MPIPGTKRRTYLEENLASAGIALSSSDMQALDEALVPAAIAGNRYPDWVMATIDR